MSTAATSDQVIAVLRGVMDPELGDNIVDLGMVRGVDMVNTARGVDMVNTARGVDMVNTARGQGMVGADPTVQPDSWRAEITIALTTAGCPLRATIKRDVESRVEAIPGVVEVRLIWDELNAAEKARVMERARMHARDGAVPTRVPPMTRVLAIASGKGGVGKSSVTVNLATQLAARGFTVGVMDADIWGFSIPRMLGVDTRLSAVPSGRGDGKGQIQPQELSVGMGSLKVVSTGLMVETEETALMWRGLMLAKAVEQFLNDVAWGEMDYLVIDMPPGTGDVQMALSRLLPQAEMLVVTTPSLSAQKVAIRVADMARRSHMPVLGVIENMGAFVAPDGSSHALFGSGGGERLAADLDVPLLGSIPLEPAVSAGGDTGRPVVTSGEGRAAQAFRDIVDLIVEEVAPPRDAAGCSAHMLSAVEAALDAADL